MRKDKTAVASSSKIKFDDHESSSEDEEKEIEEELADVTFEELQRARADGSDTVYRKFNSEGKTGRANKNRPMEVSSKKPVSRFREIIQVPKKATRDPRFETLTGQLDVERFKKRYNFLYEDNLPAEKEDLKKQLRKSNDPEEQNELKSRISWINKQLNSSGTKHTEREILAEHKKKEREAAKQGKQPYYLKKSEIKKRKLIEKYKELKASGKLEAYIEKKRRKNAAKDHRFLPYRRPGEQEN
ncbi:ribosomal RNA processing protein 36 [Capsicum galapagoense]